MTGQGYTWIFIELQENPQATGQTATGPQITP